MLRPASVPRSTLMPRLLLLLHRKTGPHSHHWSQSGGRPAENRMPSGRRTPSILITSAPRAPSSWVATGPAQNAVRSVTRMPDSGRVPASSPRAGSGRGGQCTRPLSAPNAGGSDGGRVVMASLR